MTRLLQLASLLLLCVIGYAQTTITYVPSCTLGKNGGTCPTKTITIPAGKQGPQGIPGPPAALPASLTITLTCQPASFTQASPIVKHTITLAGLNCTISQVTAK